MTTVQSDPGATVPLSPATIPTRYWHRLEDGRVQCDLCPRFCRLHEGQAGFCFVRACRGGEIVLTTYGRSSGFCVDPIEKKPLFQFLPGTAVLSFGTAGCNLGCTSAPEPRAEFYRYMDAANVDLKASGRVSTSACAWGISNPCSKRSPTSRRTRASGWRSRTWSFRGKTTPTANWTR